MKFIESLKVKKEVKRIVKLAQQCPEMCGEFGPENTLYEEFFKNSVLRLNEKFDTSNEIIIGPDTYFDKKKVNFSIIKITNDYNGQILINFVGIANLYKNGKFEIVACGNNQELIRNLEKAIFEKLCEK